MITKLYPHRGQTQRFKKAKETKTKQWNSRYMCPIQTPGRMLIGRKRKIAQLLKVFSPLWFTFLLGLVQCWGEISRSARHSSSSVEFTS